MGTPGASEPTVIQGFTDQIAGVSSDSGFFFQTGGGADADKEICHQQRGAQQSAAGVGGEGTGALGIESTM